MIRKLLLTLAMASLVFYSSFTIAAGVASVWENGYSNGMPVFYVQLRNETGYRVYCVLTANNGAHYRFYLNPYAYSKWFVINDRDAIYQYICKRY